MTFSQNVDPFGAALSTPAALTAFKLANRTGLTQAQRAELRLQYEAEVEAAVNPSAKPTATTAKGGPTADDLLAIAAKREKAFQYVEKADEVLATHGAGGSLADAVDEIADEDEFGAFDEEE